MQHACLACLPAPFAVWRLLPCLPHVPTYLHCLVPACAFPQTHTTLPSLGLFLVPPVSTTCLLDFGCPCLPAFLLYTPSGFLPAPCHACRFPLPVPSPLTVYTTYLWLPPATYACLPLLQAFPVSPHLYHPTLPFCTCLLADLVPSPCPCHLTFPLPPPHLLPCHHELPIICRFPYFCALALWDFVLFVVYLATFWFLPSPCCGCLYVPVPMPAYLPTPLQGCLPMDTPFYLWDVVLPACLPSLALLPLPYLGTEHLTLWWCLAWSCPFPSTCTCIPMFPFVLPPSFLPHVTFPYCLPHPFPCLLPHSLFGGWMLCIALHLPLQFYHHLPHTYLPLPFYTSFPLLILMIMDTTLAVATPAHAFPSCSLPITFS